jgi:hypothetical protein
MAQKFHADPATKFVHPNGAVGYGPGGSFDCLGAYAKVRNCPIECEGVQGVRLTAYATGYAETFFSIPACTRFKGRHIGGYFTGMEDGVVFRVYDRFKPLMVKLSEKPAK